MQPCIARRCYAHTQLNAANTTSIFRRQLGDRIALPKGQLGLHNRHWRGDTCQRRSYRQHQCTWPKAMSTKAAVPQARLAPGSDELSLTRELQPLLASATTAPGQAAGRWALVPSGDGLERSFKFKTFAKTWDFMTAVALQCKLKNHHPEWSNIYNTTFIRWTTHNPRGLSALDIELASICDRLARDFGEVVEEKKQEESANSCSNGDEARMRHLADAITANAGDCCTPKKSGNDK